MKKRIAAAFAAAGLAFAAMAPANAAQAPDWAGVYGYLAEMQGTPGTPGTVDWGIAILDVRQPGVQSGIGTVSLSLGNGISLTSGSAYIVSDECDTSHQSVTVSGSVVTIKGIWCIDGADGNNTTDFVLLAGDLVGTIASDTYFDDRSIELQYRTNGSRRDKVQSWRYTNPTGLDFVPSCGGTLGAIAPERGC